jgi:NRAMP (natural resistance-associated macrophage protein)-like metal ion transporter
MSQPPLATNLTSLIKLSAYYTGMRRLKKFVSILGPGLIAGASDDDPTAIATYMQSGAQFEYHQLWTTLFTLPFMIVIQEMTGRIGIATGKGISAVVTRYYSKYLIYIALVFLLSANIINIGADIGAMAASLQLLWHIPILLYFLLIAVGILSLQLFVGYKKFSTTLKYASFALLAYVGVALVVKQPWAHIASATFIPFFSFHKAFLLNLVAIFGTNISPYLFFWQASEEVEEQVAENKQTQVDIGTPKTGKLDINRMRIDTITGMIFSNLILFFVEIAAASTLGAHGIGTVNTPAQAAQALEPFAGGLSFLLFTVGIIASGFLAIPVLSTSCAYAVAELWNKRATLQASFRQQPVFYILIIGVTSAGLLCNLLPIKPFDLLVYSAALNGVSTPLLIGIVLLIANNRKIMRGYTNSWFSNALGILLAIVMLGCAGSLIWSSVG